MIFSQDRNELRQMYANAWAKHQVKTPLSPLEAQIAAVIELHPEYQDVVSGADIDKDYTVEEGQTNPFLHMGLHLGIREQIATNRPAGIARIFEVLAGKHGDPHEAEHRMIDCLAETLWESQSRNRPPDEQAYIERLKRL